jgi:hypothetical protein
MGKKTKAPHSFSEQAAGERTHREATQSDSFSPTAHAPPLPASEAPRPVNKVTLQPSVASRDGYYFKLADGSIQGPLSADKFDWYRLLILGHSCIGKCCAVRMGAELRHRQPAGVNERGGSNPE